MVRWLPLRPLHLDGETKPLRVPEFSEFKPLELEDKEWVDGILRRFPPETCEMTFANMFIWRNVERPFWTMIDGTLCVLCRPDSEPPYFLPPAGPGDPRKTAAACFDIVPRLSRVPESLAGRLSADFAVLPDRDNADYVYRTCDLAELNGKKFDGKRNRIRKFTKNHVFSAADLDSTRLSDCRRLLDVWAAEKAGSSEFEVQKSVIGEAIDHFVDLDLCGCAVLVGGRVEAFSIGGELSADTAVVHIEIGNPAFEGLPQLINRECARRAWTDYAWINREQDAGHPGLRKAKLSYRPHHLITKYNITPRG